MLINNRWVRASGSLQDKPISIQFREDWQLARDQGDYHLCVQIAWHAQSLDDSTGFPSAAEQVRIVSFTDQLQARLEPDEGSFVMMMITHSGVNQWIIYTRDLDTLRAGLDSMPVEEGLYPIEVVADEDPQWNTFIQVHSRIDPVSATEISDAPSGV
ncbi:MAG: hypothetical protein CMI00_06335 [Oceanospirillaceae bacterium]|nr:hypothetical protein [Oceanospirillaceae bacterium]|tara:strand:+ start:6328 stop:6798 length:471 start_codon:yes stop_codon:yes gene_type:complete